jgi:hypothetical protein
VIAGALSLVVLFGMGTMLHQLWRCRADTDKEKPPWERL